MLMSTQVFKGAKRYKEGRGEMKDDPHSCRPCASKTDANIEKVGEIVQKIV
jgi:K+/H+ antiporter YhaU regulatory subunit KhtT